MERKILIISGCLIILASGLMGYKVWGAGYSLVPHSHGDIWSVEMQFRFRAKERHASVRANLPVSHPHQRIFDAQNLSPALTFSFRKSDRNRENTLAVWTGRARDVQVAAYRFSVQTQSSAIRVEDEPQRSTQYPDHVARWLQESAEVPFRDPAIQEVLNEIAPSQRTPLATITEAYNFVLNEIAFTASKDQMDALIALNQQQANSRGKARLLCALSRASGIPCRIVGGIILKEGQTDELHLWTEIFLSQQWTPICPTQGYFGKIPKNYLELRTGGEPILQGIGTRSFSYLFVMAKQPQTLLQLYTGTSTIPNGFLRSISLFALPIKTQIFFRILLLIPLGTLIVALFRNIIGIPSFGIFTPILIALAFRDTGLLWGIFFLSVVVLLGVLFRYILDSLQLLLVPRLAFLLSFVVLLLLGISLAGGELGTEEAVSVALFPIVIMTSVIERFSIALAEEGTQAALLKTFWTVLIALVGYLVMAIEQIQLFLFAFPETIFFIMALLLLVGRYTGYRVNDVLRFRSLAAQ